MSLTKKNILPKIPALNETIKIEIVAASVATRACSPLKARFVTNIDIVKPIPPNAPAPKISTQVTPLGLAAIPSFYAKNVKLQIPRGFPTPSPKNIPKKT